MQPDHIVHTAEILVHSHDKKAPPKRPHVQLNKIYVSKTPKNQISLIISKYFSARSSYRRLEIIQSLPRKPMAHKVSFGNLDKR